jgi:hypothetical protein
MTEWRESPSFTGYLVSDDGRVIGRKGHELGQWPDGEGYLLVKVAGRKLGVHQLVCEAFHGPKPTPKHEVAHGDGHPTHNRSDNLRWATSAENKADSMLHGTFASGEAHGKAKLTWAQVREIRFMHEWGGISQRELGARYGVHPTTIGLIVLYICWLDDPQGLQ